MSAVLIAHAATAVTSVASNTDVFRLVTDGGIVTLIGGMAKLIFDFGRFRQTMADHGERIERIERARDAEAMANYNGYRPRSPSAHD